MISLLVSTGEIVVVGQLYTNDVTKACGQEKPGIELSILGFMKHHPNNWITAFPMAVYLNMQNMN